MRERDDDGGHAAAGQQSALQPGERVAASARLVGDARRVAVARIVVAMRGHASFGRPGLRATRVPDRRRLPGRGDERTGQDGLPSADRVRELRPCGRSRRAARGRSARSPTPSGERFEHVDVGERLLPQAPPGSASASAGIAARSAWSRGDPRQLPEIVPRARRTRQPGAGEPERRPCSSTSGQRLSGPGRAPTGGYTGPRTGRSAVW